MTRPSAQHHSCSTHLPRPMRWRSAGILALVALLGLSSSAWGGSNDPAQLIGQSWSLYRSGVQTELEQIQVRVERPQRPPEMKSLVRWTRFSSEGDKVRVQFKEPALDKGLGLLVLQPARSAGTPAQMWLRMPSWTQARRLSGDRESRYFGGTDLTFEDNRQLLGEAVGDFDYQMLSAEPSGWRIEARPKSSVHSGYGKRIIQLTSALAVERIDYHDLQGRLLKVQRHPQLQVDASGRWRPLQVVIDNLQEDRCTVIDITQRQFDPGTAASRFNPDDLSND
ncbi:MAG: outer membrane lipoprotein-sorting protein [Curvibacter sp.]|nr:MAG: outer membrane lipoprotein-sorting protein [Curvibacter sp.]